MLNSEFEKGWQTDGTILAQSWHNTAYQMALNWHTFANDTQIKPCYNCTE